VWGVETNPGEVVVLVFNTDGDVDRLTTVRFLGDDNDVGVDGRLLCAADPVGVEGAELHVLIEPRDKGLFLGLELGDRCCDAEEEEWVCFLAGLLGVDIKEGLVVDVDDDDDDDRNDDDGGLFEVERFGNEVDLLRASPLVVLLDDDEEVETSKSNGMG
jgi:hypothetical protein